MSLMTQAIFNTNGSFQPMVMPKESENETIHLLEVANINDAVVN